MYISIYKYVRAFTVIVVIVIIRAIQSTDRPIDQSTNRTIQHTHGIRRDRNEENNGVAIYTKRSLLLLLLLVSFVPFEINNVIATDVRTNG